MERRKEWRKGNKTRLFLTSKRRKRTGAALLKYHEERKLTKIRNTIEGYSEEPEPNCSQIIYSETALQTGRLDPVTYTVLQPVPLHGLNVIDNVTQLDGNCGGDTALSNESANNITIPTKKWLHNERKLFGCSELHTAAAEMPATSISHDIEDMHSASIYVSSDKMPENCGGIITQQDLCSSNEMLAASVLCSSSIITERTSNLPYNSAEMPALVRSSRYVIGELSGRRIVDIRHLFNCIQATEHIPAFGCTFKEMELLSERRNGFYSTWIFKCRMCSTTSNITSEALHEKDTVHVNKAAIHGIIAIGGGYTHLAEFSAALNMPCMASSTFSKHQSEVSEGITNAAKQCMTEAGQKEKELAFKQGRVDSDGIPKCTVVADCQWGKRSYGKGYQSLSGGATIIGFNTKEVLFSASRHKFCVVCTKAKNRNQEPPKHDCFKNWNKSSSAMEADIIAEGFMQSVEIHGLKYDKLIGDGDSSVHRRLLDLMPNGPNCPVEKVECRNHLLRNYCTKLNAVTKNTTYPPGLRKELNARIVRLRIAVTKAIAYRKSQDVEYTQKLNGLKNDIENGPYHIFGEHSNCGVNSYFCKHSELHIGEENCVPALKESGMLMDINLAVKRLITHANSLLHDVDNNVCEQFNSVVNKYISGKRVCYSMRGSYKTRCEAAVVSFNSKKYLRTVHKALTDDKSPGVYTNKFLSGNSKKAERTAKRKLDMSNEAPRKKRHVDEPDEHYGLAEVLEEIVTDEEMTSRRKKFMNSLVLSEHDRLELEKNTRDQSQSQLWRNERRKRLTASNFGSVCLMRDTTSCRSNVFNILYSRINTVPMQHGKKNETVAKTNLFLKGISVKDCGMFVDKNIPYLAASPDGVVDDSTIVEIKCPISAESSLSAQDAIKNGKIKYLKIQSDEVVLKENSHYYYQVQGQLHITGREKCIFSVYTSNWMALIPVYKDDAFWLSKMEAKLKRFYEECLLPEIVAPMYGRRMLKTDIRDPTYIREAISSKQKIETLNEPSTSTGA